jgi:hypothetical protein
MQSARGGGQSARDEAQTQQQQQQQMHRPTFSESADLDFVTSLGTDFNFKDSDRIEAESALVAPGGSSKYALRAAGDSDASGPRCFAARLDAALLPLPCAHARF